MTKDQDVLLNFIVDRSGSMMSVAQATVDGINQFLKEQIEQPGKCLLSLTLFDHNFDVRYVAEDARKVPPMQFGSGPNPYVLGGSTALYDAVGVGIKGTEEWLKKHPKFQGKVITVIMTDGEENASREWHIWANPDIEDDRDINNLIRYKQGEGWEFVFMGAGQSAWLESNKFVAVAASNTVNYAATASSTLGSYAGASGSVSLLRSGMAKNVGETLVANTANVRENEKSSTI